MLEPETREGQLPAPSIRPICPQLPSSTADHWDWLPRPLHARGVHVHVALKHAAPQSEASDKWQSLIDTAKAASSGSYTIFLAWKLPWNHGCEPLKRHNQANDDSLLTWPPNSVLHAILIISLTPIHIIYIDLSNSLIILNHSFRYTTYATTDLWYH